MHWCSNANVYKLVYYRNNCSKTSVRLWQYYRVEPFLDANGVVADFTSANNNSAYFIFKQKITRETIAGGTKKVEKVVLLKYLSKFWKTLEMLLINCKISLILNWSNKCVLSNATTFAITDTDLHVPVVTLQVRRVVKLQKLKSDFLKEINWNKYQSKVTIQAANPYLDYLLILVLRK